MQKSAQPLSRRFGAALPPAGAARILAVNGFVGSLGTGLFLTGSVLYYTRVVGLSDAQVGLGLSVAGICGMLGSVPIGRLADRWGPRQMMVVLHLWRGVGYALLAPGHGVWAFLVVGCLVTLGGRGGPPGSPALVGALV